MPSDTPIYVAFEGGDGSGKSTQSARLVEHLDAVATREPGGTDLGRSIRDLVLHGTEAIDPWAEFLLYAADRAHHMTTVVEPALAAGRSVVSDRSAYSSLAYQGVGRELGLDAVRTINDHALRGRWPDVVILLDLDPDRGRQRLGRELDRLERAGATFHARVRRAFLDLAAADPERWLLLDASRPRGEITSAIIDFVDDRRGGLA